MSLFNKVTPTIIEQFRAIAGAANVLTDEDVLKRYSHDETEDLSFLPEVAVKPDNAEQISEILRLCNEYLVPVTPRGGGTGLSGAALPVHGGVLLSMERLNRIIAIDERNMHAVCEPGVITEALINEVNKKGFLYPVDPSSKGSCFLGGNMAHGSGGPRVVKYGTIRDYVLNMEVVLPTGEIIWTGANTIKYASGYNLTQLMIGSEGTLGVITKMVLKLIPKPSNDLLLLASFVSAEKACEAVSAVFRAGITPSAMEFMEKDAVDWVIRYADIKFETKPHINAYLLIEVDGNELDVLMKDCERISEVMDAHEADEILFADSSQQKEDLWKMRRSIALSVKANSVYKEEDTVVPRAELPALVRGLKAIGEKYSFRSVCYGHAGDGNLHINIIKGNMSEKDWKTKLPQGIRELFELTVKLGGTLSGEHGIGYVQKGYMNIKYSDTHLNLMRGIKKVFDPNGILNPGKVFD